MDGDSVIFTGTFSHRRLVIVLVTLVLLVLMSCNAQEDCYIGTTAGAGMYSGTVAVTKNGRVCQRWDSQTPHSHSKDVDTNFPIDGSVSAANNYCRAVGKSYVWCYTVDPTKSDESCSVPVCTNLPCTLSRIGPSSLSSYSTNIDSNTQQQYLAPYADRYGFRCCGVVKQWKFTVSNPGTVRMQVWRLVTGTSQYVLRGENVFSYGTSGFEADETLSSEADRISVNQGDLIGWYTYAIDMIPWGSSGSVDGNIRITKTTAPSVGVSVDFATGATILDDGGYSIKAYVSQNHAPTFTSTLSAITILDTLSASATIYTASATDTDVDDVPELVFSLDSTEFAIGSSSGAVTLAIAPVIGSYTLTLVVADHCTQTDEFKLKVFIVATGGIPDITNLPGLSSVSETINVETEIFPLTITPADTYACVIDSYTPTRTAGNPFEIKLNGASVNTVYLKNAANILYSDASSITVTITCVGSTASVTEDLIINIDPNGQPTFASMQASVTISALNVSNGDTIYTATVTDPENDPITMAMTSCEPSATCPFAPRNNFELYSTENLDLHKVSTYEIYLSADDSYNTVGSSLLTVVIIDINDKPVFTNIPIPKTILENTVIGTEVIQVSCNDGNGDTLSYSATFSPGGCTSMYDVDSTTGSITTLMDIDYETMLVTLRTCVITVTAWDGREYSDPEDVTVTIEDVDEPPTMSNDAFLITTDEVVDNTDLPDQGISATDPESTAVTLTVSCPGDSEYLTIHATTGIITIAAEYDLDKKGQMSYTITCTVTATDATSQTSTSMLEVVVNDANDNAPIFTNPAYSFTITPERTSGVFGSVNAADDDMTNPNNAVVYSMTASALFSIDPATGDILLVGDITGVTPVTTYTLTATATDGPGSSSSVPVLIIVSDVTTTTAAAATSSNGTFFGKTHNIIWFSICMVLGTLLLGLATYLVVRICRNTKVGAGRTNGANGATQYQENEKVSKVDEKEKMTKYDENDKNTKYDEKLKDDNAKQSDKKSPDERPASAESGVSMSSRHSDVRHRPSINDLYRTENETGHHGNEQQQSTVAQNDESHINKHLYKTSDDAEIVSTNDDVANETDGLVPNDTTAIDTDALVANDNEMVEETVSDINTYTATESGYKTWDDISERNDTHQSTAETMRSTFTEEELEKEHGRPNPKHVNHNFIARNIRNAGSRHTVNTTGDMSSLRFKSTSHENVISRHANQTVTRRTVTETRRLPPSMTFGATTKATPSMVDVMQYSYYHQWNLDRPVQSNPGSAKKWPNKIPETSAVRKNPNIAETKSSNKRKHPNIAETRTSKLMKQRSAVSNISKRLWQMPKFANKARPVVTSHRTSTARQWGLRISKGLNSDSQPETLAKS